MVAARAGGSCLLLAFGYAPGDRTVQQISERALVRQFPQAIGGLPAEPLARIDVAVRVDGQEHAEAVAERADLAVATAEALAHLVERRDRNFTAVLDVVVQHLAEQPPYCSGEMAYLSVQEVQRRNRSMDREVQPLGKEKVKRFSPARRRIRA